MSKHVLKECDCGKEACPICCWGAAICTVCGKAANVLEKAKRS